MPFKDRMTNSAELPSQGMALHARRSLAIGLWTMCLVALCCMVAARNSGEEPLRISLAFTITSNFVVSAIALIAWMVFRVSSRSSRLSQGISWMPTVLTIAIPTFWGMSCLNDPIPVIAWVAGTAIVLIGASLPLTDPKKASHDTNGLPMRPQGTIGDRQVSPGMHVVNVDTSEQSSVPSSGKVTSSASLVVEEPQIQLADTYEDDSDVDVSVTQWMSRRFLMHEETIEGWIRVTVESGCRDSVLHVSFCPPFATTPKLTTKDLDGVHVEIRPVATFPFGARLAIRLKEKAGSACSFRIGFTATAENQVRAA